MPEPGAFNISAGPNAAGPALAAIAAFAFGVVILTARPAPADVIPVPNADFSSPVEPTGNYGLLPTDWNGLELISTTAGSDPGDISLAPSGDAESQNAWSNGGDGWQVLSATLQANSVYTLTVDVGQRLDVGFPSSGTAIELGYGNVDENTVGSDLLTPVVVADATPTPGGWAIWQSTFTTGPSPVGLGDPLYVDLLSGGQQVEWDDVSLSVSGPDESLPEPGSLSIFALGGLALLTRRQRADAAGC